MTAPQSPRDGAAQQPEEGNAPVFTWTEVERWIRRSAELLADNRDHLTDLDAAIGDADHGTNMHRGFQAVLVKLDALDGAGGSEGSGGPGGSAEPDVGGALKTVGMTLLSSVGGASGPLYGMGLFLGLSAALAGRRELGPQDWAAALEAGVRGVQRRGKAEPGDKTMVDALLPALDALRAALDEGAAFEEALARAADASGEGMRSTIPMVAKKGRASYLGERSAGHQDPGATSSYLLMLAAAETLGSQKARG